MSLTRRHGDGLGKDFSLCLGSPAFSAWEQLVLGWQEGGGGRSQPYSRGRPWECSFGYRLPTAGLCSLLAPSFAPLQPNMSCIVSFTLRCVLESNSHAWVQSLFLILNRTPAQMCFTADTPGPRCAAAWTDLLCYPRDSREVSLDPGSWNCRQLFSTGGRLKHSQKWARVPVRWKKKKKHKKYWIRKPSSCRAKKKRQNSLYATKCKSDWSVFCYQHLNYPVLASSGMSTWVGEKCSHTPKNSFRVIGVPG